LEKISDYSGQFRPEIKLEDFSSDTLSKLGEMYSKLYMALDGFWYLTVMERLGNDEALACDIKTWESQAKYEMAKITKQLNIEGNDVIALMKALQFSPWSLQQQYQIDIKDKNNATLTITHCPTLDALEKEGQGRENEICNIVDLKLFKYFASFFNPDAEIKCLKSPPRKSKDEICCQWEFKL